jgi:Family of unknown function (DUF6069)
MTTTLTTTSVTTDTADARTRPLYGAALACGAVAAVATTAIAAVADAAGVSFEVDGEPIPLLGFAQMTLLGAVLGLVIARLCRRAAHPRATFVRITVALTALSVVPDFTMSFDAASRIVLVLTHVTAAAIIVPVLARRLPAAR